MVSNLSEKVVNKSAVPLRRSRAKRILGKLGLMSMFAVFASVTGSVLVAQDGKAPEGVRIGIDYRLGTRPGALVLPIDAPGGDSIRTIIQRDLDYDDRVTLVNLSSQDARAFIPMAGKPPNYDVLAKLGVAALIHPRTTLAGITVTMYDVASRKAVDTQTFPIPSEVNTPSWRMALHGISDQIGFWIFGTRGAAQTRILYDIPGKGELWMIDSDGANPTRVARGDYYAMSASWHPNGSEFVFSAQSSKGWQIGHHDLLTGETHFKTASILGQNTTPAYSPDGRIVAYSNGVASGGTNIVVARVGSSAPAQRITVGRGSDNTSPSFSPDGRRLVFMSGRAGYPELYIMDIDGTNVQRLTETTYGERSFRASPDWSPTGNMVAYQSRVGRDFQILTIDMRDRSTKQYTSDGENEDPSWSPDGRHIVFSSTRSGVRQLWVVDVESGRLRQLTRQPGARLPSWSSILKR